MPKIINSLKQLKKIVLPYTYTHIQYMDSTEKRYECIYPDGKIEKFNTLREISNATKLEIGLISRYMNGKRKTIGAKNPGRPAKGIDVQQGFIIRRNKNMHK